jgi:hypothetical protein
VLALVFVLVLVLVMGLICFMAGCNRSLGVAAEECVDASRFMLSLLVSVAGTTRPCHHKYMYLLFGSAGFLA